MSDDWLRIIPTKPDYIPTPDQIQRAISILAPAWSARQPRVIKAKEEDWSPGVGEIVFQVVIRDDIEFIDNGANLDAIKCPHCNQILAEDWWGEAVDKAHKAKFRNLTVQMPCCGRQSSLNDLSYDWPVGFARFSISIMNPVREDATTGIPVTETITRTRFTLMHPDEETLIRVGEALGCSVREIIAHY